MKKLRITAVLIAAGVVAAAGLFAQEIKFDGYVNSGLGVVYSSEADAPDPFIAAAAVDSWQNAFRIRLHATYTNEAGTAGAFLRFQAQGGVNNPTFPAAYGWFSAFNKILTVKAGLVDDATWGAPGFLLGGADQGEGLGALARISPVDGLDIGLGAYLIATPGNGGIPGILTDNNYPRDLDDALYTLNVAYALPNVVKIFANFRPKSEANNTQTALSSQAIAGVSLLAVPGLKAILELQLDKLDDFGEAGKTNIFETFQYDLGSLSLGLWAAQWLSQADTDKDLALYVNPYIAYAFGSIVPRLDLGYGTGARASFNNKDNNDKLNLNWHRQNYAPAYNSDVSVISIRPSVKFNIDPTTFVELGDLIDIDGVKDNLAWKGDDSRISNVFYVDFKWTF